ncbi:sugar transferase [candidate division KSB1 bacterium]|nr:sugar transferase [candidate division KSB1 bacterium]
MNYAAEDSLNLDKVVKNISKRKWLNDIFESGNGKTSNNKSHNEYLNSIEFFRHLYLIEKRHAERHDKYYFSLLIIDVEDKKNSYPFIGYEGKYYRLERVLYNLVRKSLRITDVVVKYWHFKLAVLLPGTEAEGGQTVIDKIQSKLNDLQEFTTAINLPKLVFKLYSYPDHENEINNLVNEKIVEDESNTNQLEKNVRKIKSNFLQQSTNLFYDNLTPIAPIKTRFDVRGDSILALDNPLCLLNEIFFDIKNEHQKIIKRMFDLIISVTATIILSPLLILIALGIKLTSKGPILFKQERIGYMGKQFTIYKFRTMYVEQDSSIHEKFVCDFINGDNGNKNGDGNGKGGNNGSSDKPIYKLSNDPRVTPVGKLLRRTSLDEFAQLINVIKGDMSLVGPRPPIPYEVARYDLWHKRRFLTAKPGITGLWQICGRSSTNFNDMVRLDLKYIMNWSLFFDLKILFKTFWAVISMKGAY